MELRFRVLVVLLFYFLFIYSFIYLFIYLICCLIFGVWILDFWETVRRI